MPALTGQCPPRAAAGEEVPEDLTGGITDQGRYLGPSHRRSLRSPAVHSRLLRANYLCPWLTGNALVSLIPYHQPLTAAQRVRNNPVLKWLKIWGEKQACQQGRTQGDANVKRGGYWAERLRGQCSILECLGSSPSSRPRRFANANSRKRQVMVGYAVAFLPPLCESWMDFPALRFHPGHCRHLGSEAEDGNTLCLSFCLCLSNNNSNNNNNNNKFLNVMAWK